MSVPKLADDDCPCCLGPVALVCDACGTHECWAGNWMCVEAYGAGVCTVAEYAEREAAR